MSWNASIATPAVAASIPPTPFSSTRSSARRSWASTSASSRAGAEGHHAALSRRAQQDRGVDGGCSRGRPPQGPGGPAEARGPLPPLLVRRGHGQGVLPRGGAEQGSGGGRTPRGARDDRRRDHRGEGRSLARIIHERTGREAGRGPSSGAGERSSCVTRSPESPPSGRRTGRGGPTPPKRSPAPAATRPDRTGALTKNPE